MREPQVFTKLRNRISWFGSTQMERFGTIAGTIFFLSLIIKFHSFNMYFSNFYTNSKTRQIFILLKKFDEELELGCFSGDIFPRGAI